MPVTVIKLGLLAAQLGLISILISCVAAPRLKADGTPVGGDPKLREFIMLIRTLHARTCDDNLPAGSRVYYVAALHSSAAYLATEFEGRISGSKGCGPAEYKISAPGTTDWTDTASLVVSVHHGAEPTTNDVSYYLLTWNNAKWHIRTNAFVVKLLPDE